MVSPRATRCQRHGVVGGKLDDGRPGRCRCCRHRRVAAPGTRWRTPPPRPSWMPAAAAATAAAAARAVPPPLPVARRPWRLLRVLHLPPARGGRGGGDNGGHRRRDRRCCRGRALRAYRVGWTGVDHCGRWQRRLPRRQRCLASAALACAGPSRRRRRRRARSTPAARPIPAASPVTDSVRTYRMRQACAFIRSAAAAGWSPPPLPTP